MNKSLERDGKVYQTIIKKNDFDEYVVQVLIDGVLQPEKAWYHTDDRADAIATAAIIRRTYTV